MNCFLPFKVVIYGSVIGCFFGFSFCHFFLASDEAIHENDTHSEFAKNQPSPPPSHDENIHNDDTVTLMPFAAPLMQADVRIWNI